MWPFKKIRINTRDRREREISFLGLTVIQYGHKEINGAQETYLEIFPKSFEHIFLDKIINKIGKKHDFVCLIRANGTGEAYLVCLLWDELVRKYKAQKPCIVFHRKILGDVIRVFDKRTPLYYTEDIPQQHYNLALSHNHIKYKGINFCVLQSTLKDASALAGLYLEGYSTSYPDYVRIKHGCSSWGKISPLFTKEDRLVTELVGDLDLSNFVFIIAEANAVKPLPKEFWKHLCKRLKDKGIDSVINTKTGTCQYGRSAAITVSQAMYLASRSKGIVAIRSGMLELVSSFPVQKHIIYTKFMWEPITPQNMIRGYSLFSYPSIDSSTIHEYEWKDNIRELIEQIAGAL